MTRSHPDRLVVGATGSYAELGALANEDQIELVYIPALAALLMRAEHLKGRPLSEAEVLRIRDRAEVLAGAPGSAQALTAARGYADVSPLNAWVEWQGIRAQAG